MNKLIFQKTVLPNGLRIVTVPMTNTNTVTSIVLVKTGSRYEKKEENGISHVLEHLFFSGTKKRPTKSGISREIDRIGAENNAYTAHDKTAYYVKAEAKHLDLSLDILSDMYLNSLFKPNAIEPERRVVVEEINMRRDDPSGQVWEDLESLLFQGNSLGWTILGPIETVLSLQRENFLNYVQNHYYAQNTVIAIAGNIDPQETIKKVKKYFKNIRSGTPLTYSPFHDHQEKPELNISYKNIDQAHIVLGIKTISENDPKKYAFSVLKTILGGGMSSRLFEEVRNNLGLSYYVGATNSLFEDTGYFAAYAGLNVKNVDLGIQAILKEFTKLKKAKISAQELSDAKTYIEGRMSLGLESSDSIANMVGDDELMHNHIETPEEYIKNIKKVTAEEIQSLAQEFFKTERLNLAIIGPFKDKAKFAKLLKVS